MTKVIDSFSGEYSFLSNFDNTPFMMGEHTIKSVEHGYQASKARTEEIAQWVLDAPTASESKRRGRRLELREDWEDVKLKNMIALVMEKFKQNPDLMQKLVDTAPCDLVEGNWWGDTYWGVCKGEGLNMLGKILMSIRELEIVRRSKESKTDQV